MQTSPRCFGVRAKSVETVEDDASSAKGDTSDTSGGTSDTTQSGGSSDSDGLYD